MNRVCLFFLLLFPLSSLSQQVDLVTPLHDSLIETSGLIYLDDRLITHNDSGGESALYEIDTTSGGVSRKVIIENAPNIDWEDLCYDDNYIYIGDFGNNAGSRTNLRVYRVAISDYLTTPNDTISADTIFFEYADQVDFTPTTFSTNYDAEGMISWNDSLYIFTKNWGNQWTNVYALPKTPGTYSLPRIDSINVEGFITGASYNEDSNSIILSGYTFTYPFVFEIKNLTSSLFSSATLERTQVQLPSGYSYQLEGITPIGNDEYYISTEQSFSGSSGLFRFDLSTLGVNSSDDVVYRIYPNPTSNYLAIDCDSPVHVELIDDLGRIVLSSDDTQIDITDVPSGNYLLILWDDSEKVMRSEQVVIR